MNTAVDGPGVMIRRGNKKTTQTGDTRFPGGGGSLDKAMPLQPLGHGGASKEAASETTDLVPKTRCILFSSFKKCSLVVVDDSIHRWAQGGGRRGVPMAGTLVFTPLPWPKITPHPL